MLFGVMGLFLRKLVKYVDFKKLDFHIFIENFSFSTRKICCVHPQFSTDFEFKGTIFGFIFAHPCDNKVLSISKRLSTVMIKAFCDVFSWYHVTDRIKHHLLKS